MGVENKSDCLEVFKVQNKKARWSHLTTVGLQTDLVGLWAWVWVVFAQVLPLSIGGHVDELDLFALLDGVGWGIMPKNPISTGGIVDRDQQLPLLHSFKCGKKVEKGIKKKGRGERMEETEGQKCEVLPRGWVGGIPSLCCSTCYKGRKRERKINQEREEE